MFISILAPCVGSDTQLAKEVAPLVNFNSRSLCGERYQEDNVILFDLKISTLTPCVGSDRAKNFKSVLSVISILALCLGSDSQHPLISSVVSYFNSRSLRGERFLRLSIRIYQSIFQFSLSVWGVTFIPFAVIVTYGISILAPRMGSDRVH